MRQKMSVANGQLEENQKILKIGRKSSKSHSLRTYFEKGYGLVIRHST
jgi:hypothetical protein